jgi:hypothetical protein
MNANFWLVGCGLLTAISIAVLMHNLAQFRHAVIMALGVIGLLIAALWWLTFNSLGSGWWFGLMAIIVTAMTIFGIWVAAIITSLRRG